MDPDPLAKRLIFPAKSMPIACTTPSKFPNTITKAAFIEGVAGFCKTCRKATIEVSYHARGYRGGGLFFVEGSSKFSVARGAIEVLCEDQSDCVYDTIEVPCHTRSL